MENDIIENLRMVTPPVPYAWVMPTVVVLVLLLLIGGIVYVLYRKKKLPFQEKPPVPPDVTALLALEKIRPLIVEGQHREFVAEVSRILRVYLEDRFSLAAPQLSTEEFLHQAEHAESLTTPQRAGLADFLIQCDRVKFALAGLEVAAMTRLHEAAGDFVRETPVPDPSLQTTTGEDSPS